MVPTVGESHLGCVADITFITYRTIVGQLVNCSGKIILVSYERNEFRKTTTVWTHIGPLGLRFALGSQQNKSFLFLCIEAQLMDGFNFQRLGVPTAASQPPAAAAARAVQLGMDTGEISNRILFERYSSGTKSTESSKKRNAYIDHANDIIVSVKPFIEGLREEEEPQPKEATLKLPEGLKKKDSASDQVKRGVFASMVYRILEESSSNNTENMISWDNHGRSFHIRNRDSFETKVMSR